MSVKVTDNSGGGGDYFKPKDGMYKLEFRGFEETTQRKFQSEEVEPAWRWSFSLTTLEGKEVLTDEGTPAVYSDRTKQSLNIRSNAYKRAKAILGRDPQVGEDSDDIFREMIGRKCFGGFEGGWLKSVTKVPAGME